MNSNQKKEWLIKYAKKNHIDDILDKKYTKAKENIFKKYASEIQSICAIFSALVIGIVSLYITYQNYQLTEKQTQMMQSNYKPIITLTLEENEENDDYKNVKIVNKGAEVLDFNVEIIPYGDIISNETLRSGVPIRIYFWNAISNYNYYADDCMMSFSIYHRYSTPFSTFYDNFIQMISCVNGEKLYWDIRPLYCIKINSIDVMQNEYVDFFFTDGYMVKRVSEEEGGSIVNECHAMEEKSDGTLRGKESFFIFTELDAQQVFKYILKKIRDNDIYFEDFSGNRVLYGEYEP